MNVNIAVLLSGKHGGGSNMAALADACATGEIDGKMRLVIGNFAESPAVQRAKNLGLPTAVIGSPKKNADTDAENNYADALLTALTNAKIDLICLAGYLRRLPPKIVSQYAGRVLNIHPALLPEFGGPGMYGRHVHEAVLASGVKQSGCTVHFVDENYDTGPILLRTTVPVLDDDTPETLAARVLDAEHQTYPRAVALLLEKLSS